MGCVVLLLTTKIPCYKNNWPKTICWLCSFLICPVSILPYLPHVLLIISLQSHPFAASSLFLLPFLSFLILPSQLSSSSLGFFSLIVLSILLSHYLSYPYPIIPPLPPCAPSPMQYQGWVQMWSDPLWSGHTVVRGRTMCVRTTFVPNPYFFMTI